MFYKSKIIFSLRLKTAKRLKKATKNIENSSRLAVVFTTFAPILTDL